MSPSTFNEHEKLGDVSNFATWKVRLEIIADNNDLLKYIQGRMPEHPENASAPLKNRYKKVESKAKQIIVDGLQDHLLAYVENLRKSKDMYDKIAGMYDVNNLNEIITLKNQHEETKMNKGETVQSCIIRLSCLRDQL